MNTVLTQPRLTFVEFLDYDDGTANRYELIDGIPVVMPEPSDLHEEIVDYLKMVFQQEIARIGRNWRARTGRLIQIPVGGNAEGRRPDLAIVTETPASEKAERRAIYEAPQMIVEIASSNWKDDVQSKLRDYALLRVPEYWVFDYKGQIPGKYCDRGKGVKTIVFTLDGFQFQRREYLADEVIECATFSDLTLTTHQILGLGKV